MKHESLDLKLCCSLLKCALEPEIAKKITKLPILKVQGRSRSSISISINTVWPVLVIICSMSVPICNCF